MKNFLSQHPEKLRVAIVTQFPENPSYPRGGVEAVSVNLTKALGKYSDLEIHVVTCMNIDKPVVKKQFEWENVKIHILPGFTGSILKNAVFNGRKKISEYINKISPDLIHSHDTYGLMVKNIDVPRIFTIHGFIYGDTLLSGKKMPWIRSLLWKTVEVSGWKNHPHIISISPYVRERLSGFYRGVIHDIDNPISESFFQIERAPCKQKKIFSAAVISPRKNTIKLVEALAQLVSSGINAELRLAGDIVDINYGKALKSVIKKLQMEDRVLFLGRVSSEDINKELSTANVFALVSLEENSPMGIEEAMAAGVPVITSNRCGMPYMVSHGESGFLVNPFDSVDIANRIAEILRSDETQQKMGVAGRTIALSRYHPEAVAKRTHRVYYDAISKSNR